MVYAMTCPKCEENTGAMVECEQEYGEVEVSIDRDPQSSRTTSVKAARSWCPECGWGEDDPDFEPIEEPRDAYERHQEERMEQRADAREGR